MGSFADGRLSWADNDLWRRAVDIKRKLAHILAPVSLGEDYQIINIGQWTTYWLEFDSASKEILSAVEAYLADWNIKVHDSRKFRLMPSKEPELWGLLREATEKPSATGNSGSWAGDLVLLDNTISYTKPRPAALPFDVRYQLQVCVSHGILDEHNIGREFIEKLQELSKIKVMDFSRARLVLKYAADQGKRIFDPMRLFNNRAAMGYLPSAVSLPEHCALVPRSP